jgi:FKBP-type peptidyl-prolyl cis-trans isomerase
MPSPALEIGKAFLAENATKEGVITTKSGLQYITLTEGNGKSPKKTDTVVVNYRGTLINGVEFDSSYLAGREPAEFPLNRVIKGWTEGLQLMKEGAKFRFFIPSHLAYGSRGAGIDIGADETLIFEVELLKVWED